MKKTILKILCLSLLLCSQIYAQEKVQPIMIDEYDEEQVKDLQLLEEKAINFAKKLRNAPKSTRGAIVWYAKMPERGTIYCGFPPNRAKIVIDEVKKTFSENFTFEENKILWITQMFQDEVLVEFWLVPEKAKLPSANKGFDVDPGCICPYMDILKPEKIKSKNDSLIVSTNAEKVCEDEKITYNWTVSAGEIVSGQGTKQITINLKNIEMSEIEIKLEIGGLVCESCETTASEKISIPE